MPAKDSSGRKIPSNRVMFERWNKGVKEAPEPLPPHMELDWEQNGAAPASSTSTVEAAKITAEEALTPDVVQYFEMHGLNEVLERAVQELMAITPRPADPVLVLGRLVSAEAARMKQPAIESGGGSEEQGAQGDAGAAAQPVELGS